MTKADRTASVTVFEFLNGDMVLPLTKEDQLLFGFANEPDLGK
jgi:hypothetical protein